MFITVKNLIILIAIITTTACTHRPPNVIAEIPLLSAAYTTNNHTSCSSIIANNTYAGKYSLVCSGAKMQFEVLQNYISALGEQCMKGAALNLNGIKSVRVLCKISNKEKKKWYLVPPVVTDLDDTKE
ncbi:hypothetical protein [Photobacterium sp. Alg240-V54]|uniref:hypothetical protein n=1 Tax=Photobacterium sp. Alg240-V54 TaxID=2305995 RepID=UPI0013CFEA70|nr:hypothetical protein [Photobacterium sp. Alg240-V54]